MARFGGIFGSKQTSGTQFAIRSERAGRISSIYETRLGYLPNHSNGIRRNADIRLFASLLLVTFGRLLDSIGHSVQLHVPPPTQSKVESGPTCRRNV